MNLSDDEKDFLFHKKKQDYLENDLIDYYRLQREKGTPHAYLTGRVEFHDLLLKVSSDCLIPRFESALLVEKALSRFPFEGKILDLCSGSGALGLAVKKFRPTLDVTLADISNEALSLAKYNARSNHLEVEILQGDFFKPLAGKKFDGIICNPPYVSQNEYETLDLSVKSFEPKIALLGGSDGLKFYKLLARYAHQFLNDGAAVCLEIGKDQAEDVYALFSEEIWVKKKIEKDYSSHNRFFFLEKRKRRL